MPFLFNGQCFGTPAEALQGFQRGFPIMGEAGVVDLLSSSIDAAGVISYGSGYLAWTSSNEVSRVGTIQLVPCSTPDSAFDGAMAGEFFFYAFGVVVFAYLLGFAVGQVRKPVRQGV